MLQNFSGFYATTFSKNLNIFSTLRFKQVCRKNGVSATTSLSHRVDHAIDCDMLSHSSSMAKLLDIGGNWNTLLYMSIQSIPNVLMDDMSDEYAGNRDIFSFQELYTDPCNMVPCIIVKFFGCENPVSSAVQVAGLRQSRR